MTSPFLAPMRDRPARAGRWTVGASTAYQIPGVVTIAAADQPIANNVDYYTPIVVSTPIVVDQMAFEVTAAQAATNARIGLYAADTDWQPFAAPLADSGDISMASTGVKTYTPGTPLYLPRGRYLTVFATDSTSGSVRAWWGGPVSGTVYGSTLGSSAVVRFVLNSRTYAAFPTPGGTWDDFTNRDTKGFQYFVVLRVLAP